MLKKCILLICCVIAYLNVQAQKSYIYIELIRTIPCKVIQNGTEVPQMNKSYVLLDVSGQQEQNIDIEFGADLFPKQNFIIDGVPDAMYAYKLARSGESSFYLLDLINNGKIIESNSAVNIGIATDLNKLNLYNGKRALPGTYPVKKEKEGWLKNVFSANKNATSKNQSKSTVEKEPVSGKEKTNPYGVVQVIKSNEPAKQPTVNRKPQVVNPANTPAARTKANCMKQASEKEVSSFIEKMHSKNGEDDKLLLVRKKQFTGCLSVTQTIQIANDLTTQYGKFQFYKFIIPYVSNPQDLMQAETVFRTDNYRNKFYKLIEANPR